MRRPLNQNVPSAHPQDPKQDPHILSLIVCMQGPTRLSRSNYLGCCKFVTVDCHKIRIGFRSFEGPAPISVPIPQHPNGGWGRHFLRRGGSRR